jgi:hypothetical protein
LSNSTFISAGKFGNAQGSGTPTGLETLQGVYDNSSLKQMDISAGALALTGEKLTTESIWPGTDSLYNLGDDVLPRRWANVYVNNVHCDDLFGSTGTTVHCSANIIPNTDSLYSIGEDFTPRRWANVYADNVDCDTLSPQTTKITVGGSLLPSADWSWNLGQQSPPIRWGEGHISDIWLSGLHAETIFPIVCNDAIVPATDGNISFGASNKAWLNVYADNVNCNNLYGIDGSDISCWANMVPFTDGAYNLGGLKKWGNVYANNVDCATITAQSSMITMNGGISLFESDGSEFDDDEEMLRFNLEGSRDWAFVKRLSAGATALSLESITDQKHFYIGNTNTAGSISDYTLDVFAANASTVRYIKVKGDVLCDADSTYDIGTSSVAFQNIYGDNVDCDTITAQDGTTITCNDNIIPALNLGAELGSATKAWNFVYSSWIEVDTMTSLTGSNIEIDANFFDSGGYSLGLSSNYWTNSYITTLYADTLIAKDGTTITCNDHFVPVADSTHNLGEALRRWLNVYADNVDCDTLTAQDGTTITCNDHFVPSTDATYDLGASTLEWNNAWITQIRAAGGTNFYRANSGTGFSWLFRSDYVSTYTIHARIDNDGDMYNTNNTYGAISDGRLKKDIRDAPGYLSDIKKLKVKKYKLKHSNDNKDLLGFITSDVKQVFPGLVRTSTETMHGVENVEMLKTSVLVPMLVKSVQELSIITDSLTTTNEELRAEVISLQEENADYKNRIERLEILVDNLISPPGAPSGEPSIKKLKIS